MAREADERGGAMNDQETIKKLNTLMHLDRETARLYTEAIPTIGESDVANDLERFRRDHAKHADECWQAIRDLGADATDAIPEFDDFMRMHEDAIANSGKVDNSLMSLFMLEQAVNFEYAESALDDYPGDVKSIIDKHLAEDKQHLQTVRDDLVAAANSGTSVRFGV
jgi:hypothetical protein